MIVNDGMYFEDGKGYFVERNTGDIYVFDIANQSVCLIDCLDSTESGFRKYRKLLKKNDEIFCLPDCDKKLKIYNINTKESSYIEIGEKERQCIVHAWAISNTIFVGLPLENSILEISHENDAWKMNKYKIFHDGEDICAQESCYRDGKIYSISLNSTKIAVFDILNKNVELYDISVNDKGFSSIACSEKEIFVTGINREIYVLDKVDCKVKKSIQINNKVFFKNIEKGKFTFSSSIYYDKKLYLTAAYFNESIVCLNLGDYTIRFLDVAQNNEKNSYFCFCGLSDIGLYVQDENSGNMYLIDYSNDSCAYIDDNDIKYNKSKKLEYAKNNAINEDIGVGLKEYLEFINIV